MADIESAKQKIKALVDKYDRLKQENKLSKYNEENTKAEFIEPLFEALGWDVRNTYHPDEVTREESISKDRVDYSFRISGIPKFFLEAKALRENLDNSKFVEQAINYSWHKGCTWAVLTDFEEVKVFNAEWRTSDYTQSHLKTIACYEFLQRFEELWLLSKDSFQQGLLDKEAEKWGKKTKKTPVDKQLLSDFTRFREILSKNIARLNQTKSLSQVELNEATQRILDRLMFIRYCEDRGLEEMKLISNAREWSSRGKGQLVRSIRQVYSYFDKYYNSKIFAKHLCDELEIDNDILFEIIEGLHYTKDRSISYDFSAIEADVLGSIYEQYLGHILKKTTKSASLTESQAHRKEQGIFYTPTYIVDYIVRNTLGKLLAEKKINTEKIRVLDPACGSGSFLIKAFDVLNEYHLRHDKDYAQTRLDVALEDSVYTRKLQIVQNSIFGVDLDRQAVEVAQLNLLLKVTEKGKRLPLLQQSIKQGNSLIDVSFSPHDTAFKWKDEFPIIMNEGGFDVIVGNPPYVRQEELTEIKSYLESNYEVYQGTADLFVYFFERELKLLKPNGYFGMIVSNKWLRAGYGKNLRKFLAKYWIEEFIDFGDLKVFPDATIYPCIIIIKKIEKANPKIRTCKMETLQFSSLDDHIRRNSTFTDQAKLGEKEWNIQKKESNELLSKLRVSGTPIEDYIKAKICYGIKTGLNDAFIVDEKTKTEMIRADPKNTELIRPFLTGAEVKRYAVHSKKNYLLTTRIGVEIKNYPRIYKHLRSFQDALEKRWDKGNYWYELRACAYYDLFDKPKIVWGNLATRSSFTLDENGFYVNAPACILPTGSRYVLGVLNSKLMSYFLKSISAERRGGFMEQKPVYVSQVPIKKPTPSQEQEITELVDKMLSLNKQLGELENKKTEESMRITEDIELTSKKIDEIVYRIYGITEEEKKIIQESII